MTDKTLKVSVNLILVIL